VKAGQLLTGRALLVANQRYVHFIESMQYQGLFTLGSTVTLWNSITADTRVIVTGRLGMHDKER
jgi:hypothetical protein